MSKLVIIRGNSGSGKSTIAKRLREALSEHKTALVEQDYLRRHILGETGNRGDDNVLLIESVARFSLENNYFTIVEGIMPREYYGEMLGRLQSFKPEHTYIFYVDVSLEETLNRHATKPNRNDFGEAELREWYRARDILELPNEIIIDEHSSLEESIALILERLR